jgi:hypothetical protein
MPTRTVGEYEIEYAGVQLPEGEGWASQVTIYGPSRNPMHRNPVFPSQRVCVEHVFPTEAAAEAEALKVAMEKIGH